MVAANEYRLALFGDEMVGKGRHFVKKLKMKTCFKGHLHLISYPSPQFYVFSIFAYYRAA